MKRALIPLATSLVLLVAAAWTQTPPSATQVVTRMSSAYRLFETYSDSATIKRKVGDKEISGTLMIAMQKPNRYLLELKGERLNTTIQDDGATLTVLRPDRNSYTKTRAPQQILGANLIGNVDMPSVGAQIITQLLSATVREGVAGKYLREAKVTGPQPFGDLMAYVIAFPYDDGLEARLYVTDRDYLVRQVKVLRDGTTVWAEDHKAIVTDKPLAADTFTKPMPESARLVLTLPPLEKATEVAEAEKADEANAASPMALVARGRAVYASNGCARCHSIAGRGGQNGPDLTHTGSDPEHTPAWISDQVRSPASHNTMARMPAFGNRITGKDLEAIGQYLASLK